jgi:DNA polymerase elongation subunit (family B)
MCDTPQIIDKCIREMLYVLAKAENTEEFYTKLPSAYEVFGRYVGLLRSGNVPIEELTIRKRLSQNPDEYRHIALHTIAANQLAKEGAPPNAGESVNYIITNNRSKLPSRRVLALELCEDKTKYDDEAYVNLLTSAVDTILIPFGSHSIPQSHPIHSHEEA